MSAGADLKASVAGLERENTYLRQRVAQLTNDVADLSSEIHRLQQERERLHGRMAEHRPDPLAGGQAS